MVVPVSNVLAYTNIINYDHQFAAFSLPEGLSKGLAVNITWEVTQCPPLANLPVQ